MAKMKAQVCWLGRGQREKGQELGEAAGIVNRTSELLLLLLNRGEVALAV
jgi:hypothetical protein